jgi:hypothetical protein
MYIFFCFLVASTLYTILVIADHKRKQHKANKQQKGDEIMALDLNRTDFYKTLNFLLMMGVITFDEYTKLEMKTLSHLR